MNSNPAYGNYVSDANTGSVWTKYYAVVNRTYASDIGIGIVSTNQTGFYIDDFVFIKVQVDETAQVHPAL